MSYVREGVVIGGIELSIETGRMAKQSGGSVIIRRGDAMVLVTATSARSAKDGIDFLPLTCEYQEKASAAGNIPGGYFRREGKSSEVEILTSRLMDCPSRPLFPKGYRFDTQVIATVLSADKENPTDVLALLGASASLVLSDIPWAGPVGSVRVIRVDGQFIANPTFAQMADADLNYVVCCSREAIVMVEGFSKEVPENVIVDALFFAHAQAQTLIDLQEKLRVAVGKTKREFVPPVKDEVLHKKVAELGQERVKAAMANRIKQERYGSLDAAHHDIRAQLTAEGAPYYKREKDVDGAFEGLKKKYARELTLSTGLRIDGRKTNEIRQVTCEVGVLPRVHGSALFTRGETQALVSLTVGTEGDAQRIENINGELTKRFMLHYNFPPYSTGETKPMRGPGRREIGHGFLAERALVPVLPQKADFPYVIRLVSEILESNGSSSMASVCGGTLALLDAGAPISAPVAGIAMGLMKEGERYAVLSDILGDEDHLGDMDFKVCGTRAGITALQMDIKISGLSREILDKALGQAREGRLWILDRMAESLSAPRDEMSQWAPRIYTTSVKPDRIRDIIGPGGKTIRAIQDQTGVTIEVQDDGTVNVASSNGRQAEKAMEIIRGLTAEPEVGRIYAGLVRRITEFGAFVEIMPGTDGLVHISELAVERVSRVEDILKEGEEVTVKVLAIDRQGKIRLSRKEALASTPADVINARS